MKQREKTLKSVSEDHTTQYDSRELPFPIEHLKASLIPPVLDHRRDSPIPRADGLNSGTRISTTEAPADSRAQIPVPVSKDRQLGRYQLEYTIASGGMATVYLAVLRGAQGFQKLVAIKRMHPHLATDRQFAKMFTDEACISAKMDHPNVCKVFDYAESEDGFYISMEFLKGEPLSRVFSKLASTPDVQTNPLLPLLAARLVANWAEGLHAAHSLRDEAGQSLEVIHRDVTPHNLFVLFDGTARVTDFGIASARQRLHKTLDRSLKGKLPYMAPEQLAGDVIDRRVDIWALGVVFWEFLTGERLFGGENEGETVTAVLNRAIVAPSSVRAHVPAELDAIALKALSRNRRDRFRTAREFARELEKFLSKAGQTMPSMDVAIWMEKLFPEGLQRIASMTDFPGGRHALPAGDPSSNLQKAAAQPESRTGTNHFQPLLPRLQPELSPALAELEPESRPGAPNDPVVPTPKRRFGARPSAWLLTALLAVLAGGTAVLLLQRAPTTSIGSVPQEARPEAIRPAPQPPAPPQPVGPAAPVEVAPPVATLPAPVEVTPPVAALPAPERAAPTPPAQPPVRSAKEKKPPPPTQASLDTGFVYATTPGVSVEVSFAGKVLGSTPGSFELPVGQHTLTLRPKSGQPPRTVVVTINRGAVTLMTVPFSATTPE